MPQIFVRHAPPLLRLSLRVDCGADLRENKTFSFLFLLLRDISRTGPVTAVEGASYSVVIAGGLAIAATLAYYVVTELFVEKPADKVYNQALEQIKQDPRVMVRLGSPIKGYGSDSRNRRERQRISSRIFKQEDGTEHCQVQFQVSSTAHPRKEGEPTADVFFWISLHAKASGPNGRATVHADMYEKGKDWEFSYLIVDVTYPPAARARINVQTAK